MLKRIYFLYQTVPTLRERGRFYSQNILFFLTSDRVCLPTKMVSLYLGSLVRNLDFLKLLIGLWYSFPGTDILSGDPLGCLNVSAEVCFSCNYL